LLLAQYKYVRKLFFPGFRIMAEALIAVPFVIGVVQGTKFLCRQLRAHRPQARLTKWEKRVGEAMSMVDAHKDYMLQSAMENFTKKCHKYEAPSI
jgi:hypothetical protein